jgi:hypothetical protein
MRQLAIAVLGISLATAATAQAQGLGGTTKPPGVGSFASPYGSTTAKPAARAAPNYGVPAPEPYKRYTPPAQMKSPAPTGSTDGGEFFKPYKPYQPKSLFGPPNEPKAPKRKSLYDR